jgi:hypothetical protein
MDGYSPCTCVTKEIIKEQSQRFREDAKPIPIHKSFATFAQIFATFAVNGSQIHEQLILYLFFIIVVDVFPHNG